KIDSWKAISAEEVTYEIVAAVQQRDANRFARILLTREELQSLGLTGERFERISRSLADAADRFGQLSGGQSTITPQTKWLHFGASQPGTLPAGTDGSKRDITV